MFTNLITPRFYETDAFGHINNTVVNGWFEASRVPVFEIFADGPAITDIRLILARTEVDFVAQIFYGKDVTIRTTVERIGNSSFVVAQEAFQDGKLVSRGKAVQVHFDLRTQKSMPITDSQRAALQAIMDAAPAKGMQS